MSVEEQLDEILAQHTSIGIGQPIKQAKHQILKLIKQARIDELEGFTKKFALYPEDYDIYPDIENRLNQLKEDK